MAFKINFTADQVFDGCTMLVVSVQKRKASTEYNNSEDVKKYPFLVRLVVSDDSNGLNQGQQVAVKLKSAESLKTGQIFIFKDTTGASIPNGNVNFWSRGGYVQLSVKGDCLNAGN
ncbi:hypothetical protein [Lactobacillus mulieris]|uniref:Uncharacterized protein n=1 Tax=Lactobacillus mulieris TaxID=2508708 RepID=A0AAW5WZ20_9LACO|nr:hypothetical protein [Lactobacillus mulieris]MCZ3622829.1 hypothetical protein [Lactobacillus mulieris]MCZ3624509.1 hypothetical protein [Lactobacillus mulieris]MCZ3636830.1 hypothetical protein [Lactobacillus mulieris]MCZ3690754.1 hypothetical protein [Lactobacillus mulieris]MCZ3696729.1 hypothetical protein [Lactobacillus mulieris]